MQPSGTVPGWVGGATPIELRYKAFLHESVKVFVDQSGFKPSFRPRRIDISGDSSFFMTGVHWQSYNGPVARGTATAYTDNCIPYCADGHIYTSRASIRFANPIFCEGRFIYARVHYDLRGAIPRGFSRRRWVLLRPYDASHPLLAAGSSIHGRSFWLTKAKRDLHTVVTGGVVA